MNEGQLAQPAERVVRVIKNNEVKSEAGSKGVNNLTSKALLQQSEATALRAAETDLRSQIQSSEEMKATRGLLKKIEMGITGRGKVERSKLGDLKNRLQSKIAEAESTEKQKTESDSKAEKTAKYGVHASTVAEANKRNVSKESKGSKPWKERVVPITVSETTNQNMPTMKDALKGQDRLAEQIKFYSEHKYSAEPKYTFPIEEVRDLRQRLVKYQHGKRNTPLNNIDQELHKNADEVRQLESRSLGTNLKDEQKTTYQRQLEEAKKTLESNQKKREQLIAQATKEADRHIISSMPFYESAVRYAEEKGKLIDKRQFADGVLQGLDIFADNQTISTRIFEKKGRRNVGTMTAGYYGAGASRFDERFNNYKGESNVKVEDKIAYEIGYCAGAVIDQHSAHLAQHLRQWLAETILVSDGKSDNETALDIGYFVDKNAFDIQRKGTGDIKLANALNEAAKITSAINKGLISHRLFNESDKYLAMLQADAFNEVKILS